METVVLVIHLLLALSLIGVVLLQRSEGGGLGMGTANTMAGRGGATALAKATWWLAAAFIATSIALTIIAARNSGTGSVLDRVTDAPPAAAPAVPDLGGNLLPPGEGATPLVPAPAVPASPQAAEPAPEEPAATPSEAPAEAPAETPAEPAAEAPAEPPADAPADAPADPGATSTDAAPAPASGN